MDLKEAMERVEDSRKLDKTQIFHLYGAPWQNTSCTWRNDFSMNEICSKGSYWLGRSRNTPRWPKIFEGFLSEWKKVACLGGIYKSTSSKLWQCWYRTACTDYHGRAWFRLWPHWSTWVCTHLNCPPFGTRFSPVSCLAAACTHMPDGKPPGKSVLEGNLFARPAAHSSRLPEVGSARHFLGKSATNAPQILSSGSRCIQNCTQACESHVFYNFLYIKKHMYVFFGYVFAYVCILLYVLMSSATKNTPYNH